METEMDERYLNSIKNLIDTESKLYLESIKLYNRVRTETLKQYVK